MDAHPKMRSIQWWRLAVPGWQRCYVSLSELCMTIKHFCDKFCLYSRPLCIARLPSGQPYCLCLSCEVILPMVRLGV